MNHAAPGNDVLFWSIMVLALLLVTFVRASIRAPNEPVRNPAQAFPELAEPAEQEAQTVPPLPRRFAGDSGYVARHASYGGPPWGPAPKPPGVD
jgi:hypothetical protein